MNEIKSDRDGFVATITLNRPESMNTISHSMLTLLSEALIACDEDPEVRVIIITGEGTQLPGTEENLQQ